MPGLVKKEVETLQYAHWTVSIQHVVEKTGLLTLEVITLNNCLKEFTNFAYIAVYGNLNISAQVGPSPLE